MSRIRYFFLAIFVGLLAMSAFQYDIMDATGQDNLSIVEEQQETSGQTVEVLGEDFKALKFELYSKSLGEFSRKNLIIHLNKVYPDIYLSTPYSPPELS